MQVFLTKFNFFLRNAFYFYHNRNFKNQPIISKSEITSKLDIVGLSHHKFGICKRDRNLRRIAVDLYLRSCHQIAWDMQIESFPPAALEGKREKERVKCARENLRVSTSGTISKLFAIFGESFIRTAEDSRCIIQQMPKPAEATPETKCYTDICHIHISRGW